MASFLSLSALLLLGSLRSMEFFFRQKGITSVFRWGIQVVRGDTSRMYHTFKSPCPVRWAGNSIFYLILRCYACAIAISMCELVELVGLVELECNQNNPRSCRYRVLRYGTIRYGIIRHKTIRYDTVPRRNLKIVKLACRPNAYPTISTHELGELGHFAESEIKQCGSLTRGGACCATQYID